MQLILKENLPKVINICKEHKVKKLYAFGSVCLDNFSDTSDIDFLITFSPISSKAYADNFFYLQEKLEKLFNRKFDLVVEHTLSNPYFLKVMSKTKTKIYD